MKHPSQLMNQLKVVFCFIAASCLGIIAYLDAALPSQTHYLLTACIACLLFGTGLILIINPKPGRRIVLDWGFITILGGFSIVTTFDSHGSHEMWMYFFPLGAFFLFKLKTATLLTIAYTPIAIWLILNVSPVLHSSQAIFTFSAISTVALFLAMVKSRTNTLLEPLISTDEETGAQLENKLEPALSTEINRAEREGTGLLLMHIDLSQLKQSQDSQHFMIQSWAKTVRQQLRPFDQYYRLKNFGFAVILPHMNSEDGQAFIRDTFSHISQDFKQHIKIGFSSLNVGDSAESLIENSRKDLKHV